MKYAESYKVMILKKDEEEKSEHEMAEQHSEDG